MPEKVGGDQFALEPGDDLGSLPCGSFAGHNGALQSGIRLDFLRHMFAVFHAGREEQHRFPVAGQVHDLPAGRINDCIIVHRFRHFLSDEFAAADVQIVQICFCPSSSGNQRRKIPLRDHLLQTGFVAHFVQNVVRLTDQSSFETEWSCGQADYPDVRIHNFRLFQEGAVYTIPIGSNKVGFVHDYQIKRAEVTCFVVDALNSCYDDLLRGVATSESGGIDADPQFRTEFADLGGILFQQFFDMG